MAINRKPKKKKRCESCGRVFWFRPGAGRPRKYCRKKCADRIAGRAAWERKKEKAKQRIHTCVGCGSLFKGRKRKRCKKGCGRGPHYKKVSCPKCGRPMRADSKLCQSCSRVRNLIDCSKCGRPFWPWADNVSHARKTCDQCRSREMKRREKCRQLKEAKTILTAIKDHLSSPSELGARRLQALVSERRAI